MAATGLARRRTQARDRPCCRPNWPRPASLNPPSCGRVHDDYRVAPGRLPAPVWASGPAHAPRSRLRGPAVGSAFGPGAIRCRDARVGTVPRLAACPHVACRRSCRSGPAPVHRPAHPATQEMPASRAMSWTSSCSHPPRGPADRPVLIAARAAPRGGAGWRGDARGDTRAGLGAEAGGRHGEVVQRGARCPISAGRLCRLI